MSKDGLRYENSGIWDGGKQLTTFRAKILKEIEVYDREGCVDRRLTLEARPDNKPPRTFDIDARELNKLDWVAKFVGIPDEVCLVSGKELAKAILGLSADTKKIVCRFISMGFRVITGNPSFVHGGGVLMPSGADHRNIEVQLPNAFAGYGLPDPSTDPGNRADYLKGPLDLLRLSNKNRAIGIVPLGAVYASALCAFLPSAVTPMLIGESGAGKSELLSWAASFNRPGTDVNSLPFDLTSTARGLRLRTGESAHTLLPLDDYYPTDGKGSGDADFIEQLIMGASTTAQRQTAKSATEAESAGAIETVVMVTAEVALVTDKESRHARALYCEVGRDDVVPKRRAACLEHARNGNFARALREFIIACLSRYDRLKDSVPKRFQHYQQEAAKALPRVHRRYWANIAHIMVGVHFYLRFCLDEDVIDADRYQSLLGGSWDALVELAKEQRNIVERYSPEYVVGRGLEKLLREGTYHLLQLGNNEQPEGVTAERIGWIDGQPAGQCLGYIDAGNRSIYVPSTIDVNALYTALPPTASRLLSRGPKLFWKRMAEHGTVQPDEPGHNSVKKQRLGNGRFYRLNLPSLFR